MVFGGVAAAEHSDRVPDSAGVLGIRGVESTLDEVGTGLVDDVDQAPGVLAGVGEPQFHRVFGEEPVDRGR